MYVAIRRCLYVCPWSCTYQYTPSGQYADALSCSYLRRFTRGNSLANNERNP